MSSIFLIRKDYHELTLLKALISNWATEFQLTDWKIHLNKWASVLLVLSSGMNSNNWTENENFRAEKLFDVTLSWHLLFDISVADFICQ